MLPAVRRCRLRPVSNFRFVVAAAVHVRRVEERDAQVDGPVDRAMDSASSASPYMALMQPSPMAETSRPLCPKSRFSTASLLADRVQRPQCRRREPLVRSRGGCRLFPLRPRSGYTSRMPTDTAARRRPIAAPRACMYRRPSNPVKSQRNPQGGIR